MHPIDPQSYIRVKTYVKKFCHSIFWYPRKFTRAFVWGFRKIYLGTKSIVHIFFVGNILTFVD